MVDYFIDSNPPLDKLPLNNRPKMFLFGVPSYANMGDQAVSIAIKKFFEREYPQYQYIEIMDYDNEQAIKDVSNIITSQDIVGYTGGGNLGSLHIEIEKDRRDVFSTFVHNLTLSFPQSIHFEINAYGQKEKKKTQEAYAKNKHLIIFVRDAQSYRRAQSTFDNPIILIPDMVLYFHQPAFNLRRNGALLVLRHDNEKILPLSFIKQLKSNFKGKYGNIPETDTVLKKPSKITPLIQEVILKKLLKKFASKELILTDRFHAMIFSAMTRTPCILFGNSYGKGKHAYYDWLDHIQWVTYTDSNDLNYIKDLTRKIKSAPLHNYNLLGSFRPLKRIIERHSQKHDIQ